MTNFTFLVRLEFPNHNPPQNTYKAKLSRYLRGTYLLQQPELCINGYKNVFLIHIKNHNEKEYAKISMICNIFDLKLCNMLHVSQENIYK